MIPVDKLTQTVLEERFDSLPDNLKEALASDANLAAVVKICHDHYLKDEEKILIVQQIAALTIMGFVHTEDMGGEINGVLFLNNQKLGNAIADEIDKKIFAPIKEVIQKNYHPLASAAGEEESRQSTTSVNDVLEKIKSIPTDRVLFTGTTPPTPPKPGSALKITPQPVNLPIAEKETVKPVMAPPKPFPMSSMPPPGVPTPTSPTQKPSVAPRPPTPQALPPQAGTAASAPKPSAPAPVMLHQEVEIAPTSNAPVLRSGNLVSKNLMEDKPKSAAPPPPPPMAHLEFENKEAAKPRIVNYSAEKTALPPKSSAPIVTPAQGTGTPAPAIPPAASPKTSVPFPAGTPAVPPKAPLPMQNSAPAKTPAPATLPRPDLTPIPPNPIPHTLDLSPKPPSPPPPNRV